MEEVVSQSRHQQINKQATQSDGAHFQRELARRLVRWRPQSPARPAAQVRPMWCSCGHLSWNLDLWRVLHCSDFIMKCYGGLMPWKGPSLCGCRWEQFPIIFFERRYYLTGGVASDNGCGYRITWLWLFVVQGDVYCYQVLKGAARWFHSTFCDAPCLVFCRRRCWSRCTELTLVALPLLLAFWLYFCTSG